MQEFVVKVASERGDVGDQSLTVPSQEEETNVDFSVRFQCTLKTSRLCSCQCWMGKSWGGVSQRSLADQVALLHSVQCRTA